jgi:hypothetical protein
LANLGGEFGIFKKDKFWRLKYKSGRRLYRSYSKVLAVKIRAEKRAKVVAAFHKRNWKPTMYCFDCHRTLVRLPRKGWKTRFHRMRVPYLWCRDANGCVLRQKLSIYAYEPKRAQLPLWRPVCVSCVAKRNVNPVSKEHLLEDVEYPYRKKEKNRLIRNGTGRAYEHEDMSFWW